MRARRTKVAKAAKTACPRELAVGMDPGYLAFRAELQASTTIDYLSFLEWCRKNKEVLERGYKLTPEYREFDRISLIDAAADIGGYRRYEFARAEGLAMEEVSGSGQGGAV